MMILQVCRQTIPRERTARCKDAGQLSGVPAGTLFPRRRRAFFPAPNTADGAECCYDEGLTREHTSVAEAPAGSAKAEYVTEHVARQSSAMRRPITGTAH